MRPQSHLYWLETWVQSLNQLALGNSVSAGAGIQSVFQNTHTFGAIMAARSAKEGVTRASAATTVRTGTKCRRGTGRGRTKTGSGIETGHGNITGRTDSFG
ncbi:MAG TPA: hypothetical protein VFE96_07650 [Candidatus Bathyarchaeia archaeon]|nr:hypothetical protein [Candidatus Bathyarchaeia archaeon]